MGGNWAAGLKALTPVFAFGIGFILVMMVMWIVGIRMLVKGKILATFHKNRKKTGGLFKIDADKNCVWVKNSGDPHGEKYEIDEDMIEDVEWPAGFPVIFQTTVRSLEYVRFIPTPFHPEKHSSKNTAKTNRLTSDENVMAAVYHYAEKSLGVGKQQQSMLVLICIMVVAIISLASMYAAFKASSSAATNATMLHNIQNALGIITTPVTKK